ncbi:MAG: GAF domain-containing protein [Anaerolineales bacterium]
METSQVSKLLVEVTRLSKTVQEVSDLLAAQQNFLRMRQIALDEQLVPDIQGVAEQLDHIRETLDAQQPELAQLRALVRTMAAISSTLDLNHILNNVMDTFIELTEAERGLIVLRDPDTHELDFRIVRGMDEMTMHKGSFLVSRTVVEDVASKGQPVITTNALEDKRYSAQESIISYAVRSIICVPLKVKEDVIGVAYADHRYRKELFGEKETNFLMGFANQAAVAIENARLFDDVQRSLDEIIEIRNFLDSIFTSIVSGIITLNEHGTVINANRSAEDILGISALHSIGKPYTDIFPALYEGFDDLLSRVQFERTQQIIEINPVLPDRGAVHLNLKLSPLVDADSQRTQGVTIVIDDLTAIKRNDETLRVVNTYLSEEMVSNIQSIDQLGLGGEDREVSAIFADVRNFTTFSEQLAPETLMTVINQYLSVSSAAIQGQQGVIDKFMGDAVLGLYNTQLNPQDDHALRAVYAAVHILEDVTALHAQLPPDQQLDFGIGIHTSFVTVGNVGSPSRKEFTAIGEAVNLAKKLQECATAGELVFSEATYQQVRHAVEAEPVERQMRGADTTTLMYRFVSFL